MGLFTRSSTKVSPLVPIPPINDLPAARMQASARYLGTLDASGEKVIGHSLSAKSAARLWLSTEALDVVRIAGSFRIRTDALRGAHSAEQFNGKPVTDLLLIRWEHDGNDWETGFRMDPARSVRDAAKAQLGKSNVAVRPEVDAWVRTISKMARGNRTPRGNRTEGNQ
jgi:hypothetical protein